MTVLSGNGGTGKGSLAAYWASQLTQAGKLVLVIDSEGHPDEWYERVRANDGRLDGIVHATHSGGLLQLELLQGYAAGMLGLVIVDSAGYFTDQEGDRWGPGAATTMQTALAATGVPSLVLAHQAKAGEGDSAYGSVYWHNVPRARYSLRREDDGSRVLTCRKATGLQGISEGDSWTVQATTVDGVPAIDGLLPRGLLVTRTAREVGQELLAAEWLTTQQLAIRAGGSSTSWWRWVRELGCATREVHTGAKPATEYSLLGVG
jgi:hypothetical protein